MIALVTILIIYVLVTVFRHLSALFLFEKLSWTIIEFIPVFILAVGLAICDALKKNRESNEAILSAIRKLRDSNCKNAQEISEGLDDIKKELKKK